MRTACVIALLFTGCFPATFAQSRGATYRASADAVWSKLADYSSWPDYGNYPLRRPLTEAGSRWTITSRGQEVSVTVSQEPRRLTIDLVEPQFPGHRVRCAVGDAGSGASVTVTEEATVENPVMR